MSTRQITTYEALDGKGSASIIFNAKEEMFLIEYFDDKGHKVYTEEFPNVKLTDVEEEAQNWAAGTRMIGNYV